MLYGRSISERGREREAYYFAYKASEYLIDQYSEPIATQINNDARLKTVDSPLTLILPWAYPQYLIIQCGLIYH